MPQTLHLQRPILRRQQANCHLIRRQDRSSTSYGLPLQEIVSNEQRIFAIAFSFGARYLATASYDTTIYIWDVSIGTLIKTLSGNTKSLCLTYGKDSKVQCLTSTCRF
ncbi:hypothetical protein L1887_15576 [Cichorium endivia]|nr:hypothetical protein L1887_15576 [Cichorium endivia]